MNKIISLLGRNSLLVNYFTFFALSLLLNLLYVYLPFGVYLVGEQLVKFFLLFSVAMYVTNHRKVVSIAFWGILAVSVINLTFGLLLHHVEALGGSAMSPVAGWGVSLITMSVLLLLWNYALPGMRGIIGTLFVLELYNFIGAGVWAQLLTSLLGNKGWAATLAFMYIPFLLMILLLIYVFKVGKKRWADRVEN